ncbi:hypothetical protein MPER_08346, partial [Moniliophthora perniciosa FA553]
MALTPPLERIRACIQTIPLPTYITRPPGNLGEPKHGSLKAYDYLILFTVIFPLVLPEFWWTSEPSDYHRLILSNFVHLVASTNIISAYSTSDADAEAYMYHYVHYRKLLTQIYPVNWKPNHYYAMHNGDLLKRWGPLAELSEFPGERSNYLCQGIKINRRMYDLHHTILQQMARRCLFDGYLEDSTHGEANTLSQFCATLSGLKRTNNEAITEVEEADFFKHAKNLPDWQYEKLLMHIHLQGPPWPRAHNDPRIALDAFILPPSGVQLTSFTNSHRQTFSTFTSHKGNSCVQFYEDRAHSIRNTGFIHSIWQMPLHHQMRTFCFIEASKALPEQEQQKAPYHNYP